MVAHCSTSSVADGSVHGPQSMVPFSGAMVSPGPVVSPVLVGVLVGVLSVVVPTVLRAVAETPGLLEQAATRARNERVTTMVRPRMRSTVAGAHAASAAGRMLRPCGRGS